MPKEPSLPKRDLSQAAVEHERYLKWNARLKRITASIEGYQVLAEQQAQNVEKMMELATLMMQKAA